MGEDLSGLREKQGGLLLNTWKAQTITHKFAGFDYIKIKK